MAPTRDRAVRGQEERTCPVCGLTGQFTLYKSWDRPTLRIGRKKQVRTYAQCDACGYRVMDADQTIIQVPD